MYASSSLNGRRRRDDETYDHFCESCGLYLGNTSVNAQAFVCELCTRAENGEALPAETVRAYRAAHQKPGSIQMAVLEPIEDPHAARHFSITDLGGRILRAIGAPLRTKKPDAPLSSALAREKQRPRVFQNVDLGSLEDIDEKLRGPQ